MITIQLQFRMAKRYQSKYIKNRSDDEYEHQFDHIRHCYGPVKLTKFRAMINGVDVWAMGILRAKFHDKD